MLELENEKFPEKISYLYSPPEYITPLKQDIEKNKCSLKYLKNAILTHDLLRVLQNDMCGNIKYPTTIIEFKDYDEPRNDSQISSVSHKYFCKSIRACIGTEKCKKCDSNLTDLFKNIRADKIEIDINEKINRLKKINDINIKDFPEFKPVFKPDGYKGHLETLCPMSGYLELIFPIIIEEKILGVLFVGQIFLKNSEGNVKKIRQNFFNNAEIKKELDDYIKKVEEEKQITNNKYKSDVTFNNTNQLIDYLAEEHNDNRHDFPVLYGENFDNNMYAPSIGASLEYNSEEFKAHIDSIILSLKNLQSRLIEELKNVRHDFVQTCISDAEEHFFEDFSKLEYNNNDLSDDIIKKFWILPKIQMQKLVDILELNYIVIFSNTSITKTENKIFAPAVYCSPSKNNKYYDESFKIFYDFTKVSEYLPQKPMCCYDPKVDKIYDGFEISGYVFNNTDTRHVIFFPITNKNETPIIVLIGYGKGKSLETVKIITNLLKKFFENISYTLSMIISNLAENRAENTMMIYRHETSQIAAGINYINNEYFSPNITNLSIINRKTFDNEHIFINRSPIKNVPIIKNVTIEKKLLQDIHEHIANLTLQLSSMSSKIKILQGRYELKNESLTDIKVIKEVFMPWFNAFKIMCAQKFLKIVVPQFNLSDNYDEKYPIIRSDSVLLNQIIYNLLGNAIKYSYRGTKIKLNYYVQGNAKIITVTNYGIMIEKGDIPYELYYRGEEAKRLSDESSGIGLYVVKKTVVDILHGYINHDDTKEISCFNVPYLRPYLKYVESGDIPSNPYIIEKVTEEIKRLETLEIYNDIVSGQDITIYGKMNSIDYPDDYLYNYLYKRRYFPIYPEEVQNEIEKKQSKTWKVKFEVQL